jgi:hypothetical protein
VTEAGDEEWPLLIQTTKDDERGKYGRWLARIERQRDGATLNEDLVAEVGEAVRST